MATAHRLGWGARCLMRIGQLLFGLVCATAGQAMAQTTLPVGVELEANQYNVHVGEPVVLVAYNSYTSYATNLAMQFLEDGVPISGCDALPLDSNSNSATCTVTPTQVGARAYTAILLIVGTVPTGLATSNVETVTVAQWTAVITPSIDATSPALGQTVTLSAEVTGHGPTGTVSFFDVLGPDPSVALCTATLVPVTGLMSTASCPYVISHDGPHQILAYYSGDASHQDDWSSAISFTVMPLLASSTTTLVLTPASPVEGEPTVVMVTVNGLVPTGNVTISDGNTVICVVALDASNSDTKTASCNWTFTTAGSHGLTAYYEGDAGNLPSTGSLLVQVVQAPPPSIQIELVILPPEAVPGEPAVLRALVHGGAADGTVGFLQGSQEIAGCSDVPVQLHDNGVASADCPFVMSTAGAVLFSAVYRFHGLSWDGLLDMQVAARATVTRLSLASGAAWVGHPVLLRARVVGALLGTGNVSFNDGGVPIPGCEQVALYPLPPRQMAADCVTGFQAGGPRELTAAFSGDAQNASSLGTLRLQVIEDVPALVLTTLDQATVDQPVTVRATLAGLGPGGSVAFFQDGQGIAGCSAVVPSGAAGAVPIAECSTQFLTAGTHRLRADYSASGVLTSQELDIDVQTAPTATSLRVVVPAEGAREGQSVWLEASVAPGAVAGGQIEFRAQGSVVDGCGAVPLATLDGLAASASCEAVLTGAGRQVLEAAYPGDRAHSPSSAAVAVVVQPVTSTLGLSLDGVAIVGQETRLLATAQGAMPGGMVDFFELNVPIPGCDSRPLLGGPGGTAVAECVTRFPLAGLRQVVAERRSGTRDRADLTISVARESTAVVLDSQPPSGGSHARLRAEVQGYFPTGPVRFQLRDEVIAGCEAVAVVTLSPRMAVAECDLPGSVASSDWASVHYPGDGNNAPSEAVHSMSGQQVAGLTLVRVGQGTVLARRPLVLRALISGTAPTGSVRFLDGGQPIQGCSEVPVQPDGTGARAQCSTRLSFASTHALRAEYSGDAVHTPAAGALVLAVARNPSSIVLDAADGGLIYAGAAVRLRAVVSGAAPGGAVTFLADDAVIPGCEAVMLARDPSHDDTAQAECASRFDTGGERMLEARYGGDEANLAARVTLAHIAVLHAPVAGSVSEVEFFGQPALRFTLHNPADQPAAQVRASFDAGQVSGMAFLPTCSTSNGAGGGGSVSCENPVALGISCGSDPGHRFCSVDRLESGASLSFVVFPGAVPGGPVRLTLSVSGVVVAQSDLSPDP